MAHVTLIRPPVVALGFRKVVATPPLGLAYVASALRAAGHEVAFIDAPGEAIRTCRPCAADPGMSENGLSAAEILDRIPPGTQVIGISCMFSYEWFNVIELIRGIRARFPFKLIVLGGEHASADHEYILRSLPDVDACVLGEGEHKMVGLAEAMDAGTPKPELPGVALLDPATGVVRKNPEKDGRYRIADVNSIPRPAWDLLPISAYLDEGLGYGSLNSRTMPILASRGCPYRCTFCSSPQMWTTRWQPRDVDDLVDEIESYVSKYRVNRVEFYDLSAIIDPNWIKQFCLKLIERNLRISWSVPSGTRTEGLSKEVLLLLKESGCSHQVYPLETSLPKVCDLIRKRINYKKTLSSMRDAVKTGIVVKTHMIIGFPFESYWDVIRECLFSIRLAWIGCQDVMYFTFAPYPGSELHEGLVADGTIVKDETYPMTLKKVFINNYKDYRSWSPRMSGKTLQALCLLGIGMFYFFQFLFRPHRAIGTARRVLAGRPLTMLDVSLTGMYGRLLPRAQSRADAVPGVC